MQNSEGLAQFVAGLQKQNTSLELSQPCDSKCIPLLFAELSLENLKATGLTSYCCKESWWLELTVSTTTGASQNRPLRRTGRSLALTARRGWRARRAASAMPAAEGGKYCYTLGALPRRGSSSPQAERAQESDVPQGRSRWLSHRRFLNCLKRKI